MRDPELELEAELEDLMSVLAESDLESEAEWTLPQARDVAEKQLIPYLISVGVTDENQIADSVFYQLHPEWTGKTLPLDTDPVHQALRQEWQDFRAAAIRHLGKHPPATQQPAPSLNRQPMSVWYTSPLPPSENGRSLRAQKQLLVKVTAAMPTEPRTWRFLCWLDKLKQPNVDDRVITWRSIAPRTGPNPIIGPLDMTLDGRGLDPEKAEQLRTGIGSIWDVNIAGPSLGIMTFLKSAIVVDAEMTDNPLESLRATHDSVQRAIDKLSAWSDFALGGSSSMPSAYVAIKDWIADRQRDPRSLYSCL
jgi:hypothetical protein